VFWLTPVTNQETVRKEIEELRTLKPVPGVSSYFVGRAIEIAEASVRIGDLRTPLFVMARVLCDDFFTLYYVSLSAENFERYRERQQTEVLKVVVGFLKNRHAVITRNDDGLELNDAFIARFREDISYEGTVRAMAEQCGVGSVYDIVYRRTTLEVHGNSIGLNDRRREFYGLGKADEALEMVAALLRIIRLVASSTSAVSADEILSRLNRDLMLFAKQPPAPST
jgi:Family of unknown function (DUF5677)